MYDGHSDLKQFLMSYEATISSYGGNKATMAMSFVTTVKSVAETWYSSLQPGTITSLQKLKDMLRFLDEASHRSSSIPMYTRS
jgi:glutamate mutase epsilon subunit